MRVVALVAVCLCAGSAAAAPPYAWMADYDPAEGLGRRIAPPAGFERVEAAPGSFALWLRGLPLKKGNPPVRLFNGQEKRNQDAHFAVVDIDTGTKDLQQCADSVIRLRAEYLWSAGRKAEIHFNFTSGDRIDFSRWLDGFTPVVKGSAVQWARGAPREATHATLRAYLDTVFAYAGTLSLSKEMRKAGPPADMQPGDVFIQGGSPGHVVIVVDMAANPKSGRKVFMIAQGFMPAQDIHVLKDPASAAPSPWYDLEFGDSLKTPEWTFAAGDLKRWAAEGERR